MKYRPEIDGLRAVAVVPVVLFHAGLAPVSGGFAGVDIFFVISGYLITSLLISDLEQGRFSLLKFYERRARRILPALFFVMFVTLPFAYLWMFPLEFNDFAQSIVATTLFASNILFWLESGYFSPDAELKPLLHTWSLAIEEQYYIFFPPLLALMWRGSWRILITTICLASAAIASFASAIMLIEVYPDAVFYLLPTRAWELLVGALAAIAIHRSAVSPHAGLSVLGCAFIILGFILGEEGHWPSWPTLLPVIGTALVILFATPAQLVGRLLASSPFVGIGLISYSAYLWHQPLLAFARLRTPDEVSHWVYALIVVATFVLAYLTWRFVEQPFRIHGRAAPRVSRQAIWGGFGSSAIVLTGLALWIDATDGLPNRTAPSGQKFTQIVNTVAGGRMVGLPCDTDITFKAINEEPSPKCIFPAAEGDRTAIVIGDSHATVMSETLVSLLNEAGYDASVMTFGGCAPFPGYNMPGRQCSVANEAVYQHLESSAYDLVLVAARPQYLIADEGRRMSFDVSRESSRSEQFMDLARTGLNRLKALDSTVIYFDPIPEMPFDVGQYIRKSYAFAADSEQIAFSHPYTAYLARAGVFLDMLEQMSGTGFIRIKTADVLCSRDTGCTGIDAGIALYTDDNHLNRHGIARLLPQTKAAIASLP